MVILTLLRAKMALQREKYAKFGPQEGQNDHILPSGGHILPSGGHILGFQGGFYAKSPLKIPPKMAIFGGPDPKIGHFPENFYAKSPLKPPKCRIFVAKNLFLWLKKNFVAKIV